MRSSLRCAALAALVLVGGLPLFAQRQLAVPRNAQVSASEIVEGTLEVLVEDHPAGARVRRYIRTVSERLEIIDPAGTPAREGLQTGDLVRARGRRGLNRTLQLESTATSSLTSLSLASPFTFGNQRVAVIMVNFRDKPESPYSWAEAADVTFQQTNSFYLENSYGQTSLTGDVFGWFTLPMDSTVCDPDGLANLADQAAANAGVNLSTYGRHVYAFPANACGWWGLGTVGGYPSRAWIKGSYQVKVVAHELGHNFGDYHSKSQPCEAGSCSINDYGDDRDMMGGYATGHFNAYQKERLGWLNYGGSPPIQAVSSAGTYRIDSLQSPGTAAKALKILKSNGTYYYVESRSQVGFDAPYSPGVVLHTGNASNGDSSVEIDLDPNGSAFDSVLDPGQSYVDSAAGLTITTVSADVSGAWVAVSYGNDPVPTPTPTPTPTPPPPPPPPPPPSCTMQAPSVIFAASSTTTIPGLAASFALNVRNNDDASLCSTDTFDIVLSRPSGWGAVVGVSQLTVSPGANGTTTVLVTPATGASGSNLIVATISRHSGNGPGGTGAATVYIATALNVSVSATIGSTSQLLSVVGVGSTPVPGATVKFTVTDPRGRVDTLNATTNASGVASVKPRLRQRDPRGTYLVSARATSSFVTGVGTTSFVY